MQDISCNPCQESETLNHKGLPVRVCLCPKIENPKPVEPIRGICIKGAYTTEAKLNSFPLSPLELPVLDLPLARGSMSGAAASVLSYR